jgi:hypothetical protein
MKQTTPKDHQSKLHVVPKTKTLTVPETTLDSVVETMKLIDGISERIHRSDALRRRDIVRMIQSLRSVLAPAEWNLYKAHGERKQWTGSPDYLGRNKPYVQSEELDQVLVQSIIHSIRRIQAETPKHSSETRHQVYINRLLISSLLQHLRSGFNVDVKI